MPSFASAAWSEDSFLNRAQAPSALGVESMERITSWFLDSRGGWSILDDRSMYGGEIDMWYERDTKTRVTLPGWSPCRPSHDAAREDVLACGAQIVDAIVPAAQPAPVSR